MAHAHSPSAPVDKYYVPHGSPWPIVGSIALFTSVGGAALWLPFLHLIIGPGQLRAMFKQLADEARAR